MGVSLARFRIDIPTLSAVSIERELAWAAAVFVHYHSALNHFLNLKSQVEWNLLAGGYDVCEETLDRIEHEFGFSFWLLDVRLALLQESGGLEAQKAFSALTRSVRPSGDMIPFLAAQISWRNEDTTNPFLYRQTTGELFAEAPISEEFRAYLIFKSTGQCTADPRTISALLRYDASHSLLDYYETFVRLAAVHLSQDESKYNPGVFASSLLSLEKVLSDFRLSKLLCLATRDLAHLNSPGCK
jgi:hypothetical protein